MISHIFNNKLNLFCGPSSSNKDDFNREVDIIYVIKKQVEILM